MKELFNKKKIVIIIGIIILMAISIYILKKLDENNYEEYNIEEDFTEENMEKEESKKVIVVHITGEINKPGVIELEEGARVIDAIKVAGGTTSKADLTQINLAYALRDGQKIYIPNVEDQNKEIEHITTDFENNTKAGKININMANEKELQELPGVGPSIATKIIKYREENGGFENIEDLQKIKGIGKAKYDELKDFIEV